MVRLDIRAHLLLGALEKMPSALESDAATRRGASNTACETEITLGVEAFGWGPGRIRSVLLCCVNCRVLIPQIVVLPAVHVVKKTRLGLRHFVVHRARVPICRDLTVEGPAGAGMRHRFGFRRRTTARSLSARSAHTGTPLAQIQTL